MAPTISRMQKSRQKLRNDPIAYQTYLQNERERAKKKYADRKLVLDGDEKAKLIHRQKNTEKVRKWRQKKRLALKIGSPGSISPYRCPNTFGKAVKRVKKALPSSPRKAAKVVRKLVYDVLPNKEVRESLFKETPKKHPRNFVPKPVVKTITDFYQLDKYSWQAPGKKDTVSIKNPQTGKRERLAKIYLVMKISELYQLFMAAHPEVKVSESKFFELRPAHVYPLAQMPHNVCTCIYHENFSYLIQCLSENLPFFPSSITNLLQAVACDITNENCMQNKCKECHSIGILIAEEFEGSKEVAYRQWEKNSEKRLVLVEHKKPLSEVLSLCNNQLSKLKTHHYVHCAQSKRFKEARENILPETAVIQIDFSEKFAIKYQDEAQSSFFNQKHVTVFTCCVWLKSRTLSLAVLSDRKKQDKYSVWYYLKIIFEYLKALDPTLKEAEIFSDGCSGQFKNRYTISNLIFVEGEFSLRVTWNFMATSHGKGAVDGIGATLKYKLWTAIRSRKVLLYGAEDCHKYAEENIPGVKTFVADVKVVKKYEEELQLKWLSVAPIEGIQSKHFFKALDEKNIQVKHIYESKDSTTHTVGLTCKACKKSLTTENLEPDDEQHTDPQMVEQEVAMEIASSAGPSTQILPPNNPLKLGSFVLVNMSSENIRNKKSYRYVGILQELDLEEDEAKILFLRATGNGSQAKRFRLSDETSFVPYDNIKTVLIEPKLVQTGNRIYYEFDSCVDIFEKP